MRGKFAWIQPMRWARNLIFICLLALDFKHTFEFVNVMAVSSEAHQPVILFGPLLDYLGIPLTNGTFDAMAYAFTVTATIYFMSNTLAKRLAHNHRSLSFWIAMSVGVGLSALTNGGIMYLASTGVNLIPAAEVGLAGAVLGALVTGGLLMFASMDAWDMKSRIQKAAKTRERNQLARAEEARRAKHTPKKYLTPIAGGRQQSGLAGMGQAQSRSRKRQAAS